MQGGFEDKKWSGESSIHFICCKKFADNFCPQKNYPQFLYKKDVRKISPQKEIIFADKKQLKTPPQKLSGTFLSPLGGFELGW